MKYLLLSIINVITKYVSTCLTKIMMKLTVKPLKYGYLNLTLVSNVPMG